MKIYLKTLGCKLNRYDSSKIEESIKKLGMVFVKEKADISLINTCTVTSLADRKSRQAVYQAKKKNPFSVVIIFGCGVKTGREKYEKLKCADFLLSDEKEVIKILKNKFSRRLNEQPKNTLAGRTRALIKIQEGCDSFCSYCIVPFARGMPRDRKQEEILNEAKKKENEGYKEIIITGTNIGIYGKKTKTSLEELLKKILYNTKHIKIRLSSISPQYFSEGLAKVIAHSRVCRHIHLSIQSGSNKILKLMNRRYRKKDIYNTIKNIRKISKDIAITCDIIVGFPSEEEKDFKETYSLIKAIKPLKTHIFKYSIRDKTVAAKHTAQIQYEVKERRREKLKLLTEKLRADFIRSQLNKSASVLFEKNIKEYFYGLTDNYIRVKLKSGIDLKNKIVKIKLTEKNIIYD